MKSNKLIKDVKITFKTPIEKKEMGDEVKESRVKFITGVKISDEDRQKLKRVYVMVNRARSLAIRYIKDHDDISLNEFKSLVLKKLTSKPLTHLMTSLVSQELYHIHRIGKRGIDDVEPTSKSISFYEDKLVNNRFTINYRRDKIVFEDLDILMELDERIPRLDEGRQFYLNICVDDLFKVDYVYINVFYFPMPRSKQPNRVESRKTLCSFYFFFVQWSA